MASVNQLLAQGARRLASTAEARTLLAHAAGVEPSGLLLLDRVAPAVEDAYLDLVLRRAGGEPVQYLTGRAWFRTVEVAVSAGVFIPRPETEVMTGWAIERLRTRGEHPVVVEL